MSKQNFVHLHCHDEYSILDGTGSATKYAKQAKSLGFEHLALTNHGNVDGLIRFQNACEDNGIKPLFGSELYMVEDHFVKTKGEKRKHLNVLVKNQTGWENLLKMMTVSNLEGFYYRPRVSPKLFLDHCSGLVVTSACVSSLLLDDWGIDFLEKLYDKIGNDLYMELMPHEIPEQSIVNDLAMKFAKKHNLDIIVSNDSHYISNKDSESQEVLLAIQSKAKWDDPKRWKFPIDGLYLKTVVEMRDAFKDQGQIPPAIVDEGLKNTMLVASKCESFRITRLPVKIPRVPIIAKNFKTDIEALIEFTSKSFEQKINNVDSKKSKLKLYNDRLNHEIDLIKRQKFEGYFLMVWELVDWCKKNDIMVGPGRGSSGGSLVCYLLGITAVDPIEFGLIFARFINPSRIDYPDIDIDFEDIKRDRIRIHLEETYGKYNVAAVSSFISMKGRGAIRDVSRVFDVPLVDVNKATECIPKIPMDKTNQTIKISFREEEEGIKFKKKYPRVYDIADNLEGQVRGKGQHAAGIVVTTDDLRNGKRCNLVLGKTVGKTKQHMVNWDKRDIEHVGLMKIDVLGLNALTILNEAKRLVKAQHNVEIDYEKIPLDDKKCFDEFSKGNNLGCFQVNGDGLSEFCTRLGIENFMMLVHATSLFRPGTLHSGMADEFISRKNGNSKYKFPNEILEGITGDTFGIILYQEQIMKIVHELAGLDWKIADSIRKVIAKSQGVDELNKYRDVFINGCKENDTLDPRQASVMWNNISSFGSYGFNMSHAVEYSMITYWDMWMKINYPEEFIIANLTYGSDDKKEDMINEAFRLRLDIRPPKIGKSDPFKWVTENGIIYCPFIEIKGLGEKTAEKMSLTKQGFFEKLPPRFKKILDVMKSDFDCSLDDDQAEIIDEYFKFSFIKDKNRKYKKLLELIEFSPFSDMINIDDEDDKRDLLTGNLDGLELKLPRNRRFSNRDVLDCDECKFRAECVSPVTPSKGKYNIMIIGEAPGQVEDMSNEMFTGKAGIMLFKKLGKHGHKRRDFHLTNIIKCYPKDTKKVGKLQIKSCRRWIDEEIKMIKPFLIFALGKTATEFFKEGGRVTKLNGTTEWNENIGAWICYGIHPNSVLYHEENKPEFEKAVKNFCEKLKIFGKS